MICPKCNTVNDDNEKFCKNCGLQLNTTRICPNCNTANKPNSKFCHKCGTTLSPVDTFKKGIIEENTSNSFFSTYKIPIICALVILLAIGAVTGVAIFGGDGNNGINSIIPLANDTYDDTNLNNYGVNHDNVSQTQSDNFTENQTDNLTDNQTGNQTGNQTVENKTKTATVQNQTDNNKTINNDTNKTKVYSEKTNATNSSAKVNTEKTNATNSSAKTYTEKTNTTNSSAKVYSEKTNSTNNSKVYTEKTNKTSDDNKKNDTSIDLKTDDNLTSIDSKINNTDDDNNSVIVVDNKQNDSDLNDSDDLNKNGLNDSDDLNKNDDLNDSDDLNNNSDSGKDTDNTLNDTTDDNKGDDTISDTIEMTDVPNLAQEAANNNYRFSSISYKGNVFTQAQCIDIFSEYILNVNNGVFSPIKINSVSSASSPSGEDQSQSISQSDYISIASRVHSWIDSNNQVPNYVGVSVKGQADLSPNKMLELFGQVVLNYAVTGDMPQSVDI